MDVVQYLRELPALRRPVLVAGFRGWNDAGESASGAVDALCDQTDAVPVADIDPEEFFDFQLVRPTVRLVDGERVLEWPPNRMFAAELADGEHDLLLLSGTEPSLRWRAFSQAIIGVATAVDAELVLTLGALQVDVPHTRPLPLTGSASNDALARRLGLRRSGYEGPTGITGVLHQACTAAGLSSASVWTGVPHYLAGAEYRAGALTLAEAVVQLLGLDLSLEELAQAAVEQRDDIARLVADDDELAEYVTELEQRVDEATREAVEDPAAWGVSGEELAAELERFLRRQNGDG